jgi:hypothetical protein
VINILGFKSKTFLGVFSNIKILENKFDLEMAYKNISKLSEIKTTQSVCEKDIFDGESLIKEYVVNNERLNLLLTKTIIKKEELMENNKVKLEELKNKLIETKDEPEIKKMKCEIDEIENMKIKDMSILDYMENDCVINLFQFIELDKDDFKGYYSDISKGDLIYLMNEIDIIKKKKENYESLLNDLY